MDPDHLHVEAHGAKTGPTIVLVHGAPDRSGSFRQVLPHLTDCHVVVYDRRGYGRSLPARPATGMADHARDLLAILDRYDPPRYAVAHSFGSNPTMLAVTLRPEAFTAVGLWEPPMPWLDWWPQTVKDYNRMIEASGDTEGVIEDMYRRLLGEKAWARLPADVQAKRRAEGAAFRVDMASELTVPFDFADVRARALVGNGTETSAEHIRGARWVAEQLPDARRHVIDGAGHFAHRTHPEQFAGFVRAACDLR